MAITTKLSVSGLTQYKKDIAQATASVREYDSELKLVEETYRNSGNKADYLRAKSEVLARKLEAQTTIVQQTEAALRASAAAYGDNSTQAQQWRTKLNNARTALTQTKNSLSQTTTQMEALASGTDTAGREMTELGTESDKTGVKLGNIAGKLDAAAIVQGIESITNGLAGAARKAAQLANEVWRATTDAGAWADELKTTAQQSGIDTTTLQQWRYASTLIDTDVGAIIKARKKLLAGMSGEPITVGGVEIATGGAAGLRAVDDVFWDAIAALGQIDNAAERDAAAMDLFGRSYDEMIPLIEAGRAQWDEMASRAPVLTQEQVDSLGTLDDSIQSMEANLSGTKMQLLASLAPVMQTVATSIGAVATALSDYLKTDEGQAMIARLGDSLGDLTATVLSPENISRITTGITNAMNALTDALTWILNHQDALVTAVGAIAAAFGGLKVSESVIKFMELGKSVKNLLGGGGKSVKNLLGEGLADAAAKALSAGTLASAAVPFVLVGGTVAAVNAVQAQDVARQDAQREALAERTAEAAQAIGEDAAAMQEAVQVALGGYQGGSDIFGQRTLAGPAEVSRALEGLKQFAWLEGLIGSDMWQQLQAVNTDDSTLDAWQETELLQNITNAMADHMEALAAEAVSDGEDTAVGLGNGIYKQASYAWQAAEELARGVRDRVQNVMEIQSPSRVMEQLGAYTGEGYAEGIRGSLTAIRGAADSMAAAAVTGTVSRPRAAAGTQQGGLTAEGIAAALRSAMTGVAVQMSGERVGELVSDTVDREIGRAAYNARYTT